MAERRHYYEFPLTTQLETIVDGFDQDRREYWQSRLATEEWTPQKQLREDADSIATNIRRRAMTLQNVGDISDLNAIYQAYLHERANNRKRLEQILQRKFPDRQDVVDEILVELDSDPIRPYEFDPHDVESDDPLHLIGERLCIDDASDVVTSMTDRVNRTFEIERLIDAVLGREQPPENCVKFLALVSRCYIYGFFPECVVMCRSAMEAAFRDKVTDEQCERIAERKKKEHEFGLDVRIEAAFAPPAGALVGQRDLYKEARNVKKRGDKVVHAYEISATKDTLGTIKSTLRIIDALSSASG